MFAEIKPFLDWLHLHPHLAGFATFLIAFAESLAIVGLFIPGSVLMTAIGTLIGTGYIPLVGTVLWAVSGAILGDVLSFWLGFYYQDSVRTIWPLRSYPKLLNKGVVFFQTHGGKSVFLGRFVGPIRPVLPLIAGMMSMSPVRFLIVDIISAIFWAPLYMLPGFVLGAASQALAPEAATRLIIIVIGVLFVVSCISWLLKSTFSWLVTRLNETLARGWQTILTTPKFDPLKNILFDPLSPKSHSQLGLMLLFFISVLLFLILTINVSFHGVLTYFNESIYHFMRSLRNTSADKVFVAVSLLSATVMSGMWLAVLAWLLFRKYYWAALHWAAVGALIVISAFGVKHFIPSPRPPGLLKTPSGWSFPSGHTSVSFALFVFLAVLLSRNWIEKYNRWIAYFCGAALASIILVSRLYLTAHWLTDVIGGVLLATACVTLVTISYRRKVSPSIPPVSLLLVAGLSLALSWSIAFHHHFKKDLHDYTPSWQIQTLDANTWWESGTKQILYRTNRFGKPIEVLNLQWAGNLADIQQALTKQGWYKLSRPSLIHALNGLSGTNYKKQPFFLSQIYEDRKTVLEMAKVVDFPKPSTLIVLRIWDANFILSDGQPLWLGIISYHKGWQLRFLKNKANTDLIPFPTITNVLTQDLGQFDWKKISYANIQVPTQESNVNWDGYILLIKPKS